MNKINYKTGEFEFYVPEDYVGEIIVNISMAGNEENNGIYKITGVCNTGLEIVRTCDHEFIPMFTNFVCKHCGVDKDEVTSRDSI